MIPLAYFGARLSIVDFKSHRLPNQLVGWFTATQILIVAAISWMASDFDRFGTALGIAGVTTMGGIPLISGWWQSSFHFSLPDWWQSSD